MSGQRKFTVEIDHDLKKTVSILRSKLCDTKEKLSRRNRQMKALREENARLRNATRQ